MKRILLLLTLLSLGQIANAQLVVTNTQTPAQLVQNVLLGTGITVSNIKFNGTFANANGIRDQAAEFGNGASTNIGINNGVLLTTGQATLAIGPNNQGSATAPTGTPVPGDPDLALLAAPSNVQNAAVLEFDFIPTGEDLSFNFVFASEEWPVYANSNFNDAFGFFLSGPGITGPYTGGAANIAIIPGSVPPTAVTINNLNNGNANAGPCEYCAFYVNNTGGTTIQYNAFTTVLTAAATVQCGETYHIKLAIANVGDNSLDSGVFLQANSFNTSPLDLGSDITVVGGSAPCFGETTDICTGFDPSVPHTWALDGVILPGETSPCLTAGNPGVYCVTAYPYGPACPVTDCVLVEIRPELPAGQPADLTECTPVFNLTENDALSLGTLTNAVVTYHNSFLDATLQAPLTPNTPTAYPGVDGEVIFVRIEDNLGGCYSIKQFTLHVNCGTATTPPNLTVCDDSSNDGIGVFDFTPQTPIVLGTYSAAAFTITYHLTQADADADTGAISPINAFNGTNGQTIYVRMEDNTDPLAFDTVFFQLFVNPLPTVAISGSTSICSGGTAVITFTGTPGATVTYTVDSGANQTIVLNGSGTNTVTTPALSASSVYSLVNVSNTTTTCSQNQSGSVTVTVVPAPTATVSGTTAVCQNDAGPSVTFTGAGGTAPYTFTYTINGGAVQSVTTTAGNSVTVSAPTGAAGVFDYCLVGVQGSGATPCSQNQTGCATITVNPLPTATISGTTSVCQNGASPLITFTGAGGTAPYTFTYTINGGAAQSVTTTTGDSVTVIAPTGTAGVFDYNLVSVQDASATTCSQAQSGVAAITVSAPATAAISGSATVCQNGTPPVVTFTGAGGTAPYTFSYTINGGAVQNITTTSGTSATIAALTDAVGVFTYDLTGISDSIGCSQSQSGSVAIDVIALPTATVSGTTAVCQNDAGPSVTFTGAGGTAPYTFTYTINGGAVQSVTTTAGNSVTVSAPTGAAGVFDYCLVGVQGSGATPCSQNQTGCATITVNPLPTATISGTTSVCQNGTAPLITFTGAGGTSPYTFTYTINGGAAQSVTTTTGDSVTVIAPTGTAGVFDYNLVSVQDASATTCSQAQSGVAAITVSAPATAAISGSATVCQNGTPPVVTFTGAGGTAPYTFSYTINGGAVQNITTASGTSVTIAALTDAVGVFTYDLTGISDSIGCSQSQSGSVAIDVIALPTATVSGTTAVCQNDAGPSVTFTGAGGTAPYTFTYTINGGAVQSVTTTAGNSVTVSAPTGAAGVFDYCLVGVQGSGATPCSQNQTGCATITVNPLPTATISGTTSVCQNGASPLITFTGAGGTAPYTFTYTINGGAAQSVTTTTGDSVTVIAPTGTAGVFDYNLVSVQDASATTCSQAQSGVAAITVNTPPVINTPTPIQVCDDNNDGFSCAFVLNIRENEITGGAPGLTVTYHETAQDAISGANPITSATYCNIVAGTQTIHVSVSSALQCASYTTLTLIVNPVPIPNPVIPDYVLCDVNNPGDAIEGFDLPSMDPVILNGQTGIIVTYHTSEADAIGDVNAIDTTVPYNNVPPGPQQIWIRLESAAGCFAVSSFDLVVNPLPVVTQPSPMTLCATTGGAATASFDLSVNDNIASGGVPGMTVSYYDDLADAQAQQNALSLPYTNTSNPQTVYIVVENAATGCFDITTVTLNVNQGPPANAPQPLHECDPSNDGFTAFDLTQSYTDIFGSAVPPAGVSVTFHETATDAQTGANPIVSPYTNIVAYNQTVYVNVHYDAPPGCPTFTSLALVVHDTPQATEIDPLQVCDTDTDCIGSFDLTLATPQILGSLDPATHTVSYYVLQANAQSGTNPITNLLAFNNTTPCSQTIWVTVSDNAMGCTDIIPLELIVNPLPLAPTPAVSPYTLCDVNNPGDEVEVFDLGTKLPEILMGQSGMSVSFYVSMADALSSNNPLPNLYTNTANAQTLFVVVGNQATTCFVITTMDLRVEPLPALVPPSGPVTECDPDGDGFAQFDLDALTLDLVQGAPNIVVNYYETEQDALTGNNPITSPYTNITPLVQFIWPGAVNTLTGCRSTTPMIELNAVPSPNVPILADITICDQDGNAQNGFAPFDLTQQTPIVLSAQSGPATAYNVGYYLTQADAQAGVSPIIPADNYINTSNPQTIWVGIHDANGECFDTGSFQLIVNTPLALTTPTPLSLCDDGPTTAIPQMVFDLTVKNDEITQSLTGYTVTYYPSYGDAIANTNAISAAQQVAYTNLTNPQTLGVMVTDDATGCSSFTTLDIRVLPLPNPQANPPVLEACDDNLPVGTEVFDLTENEDYFSNGDPNLTYTYYASLADAQAGVNPIVTPTAYEGTGTVWVVVANNQVSFSGANCSVIVTQELLVNPLPQVALQTTFQECDTDGDGFEPFNLGSHNTNVLLAPQVPGDFTITYHATLADAQGGVNQLPNIYINTSNPQDIYVSVVNNDTGCVNATAVVTLTVAAGATSVSPAAHTQCADDLSGQATLDLATLFDAQVLIGQAAADFTVFYYPSLADADANTNMIANPGAYTTGSATLFAVVTNSATGCRSEPAAVPVTIIALPNPVVVSDVDPVLCVDFGATVPNNTITLSTAIPPGHTFQWYLNGAAIAGATGPSFTVDTVSPGDYTVVATNTASGCVSPVSNAITVIQSGAPSQVDNGFIINNYFADNQIITITVQGNGQYEYSLDGGPFLDNGGIFTEVAAGEHFVVVKDVHGCGEITIGPINAINYPHYFTPNGDGIHDTWNIIGLEGQPSAKIYIFDRYGKLLKQLSPSDQSNGWDGTYNGQPLPSTDYWFTVTYTEQGAQKEFKAHFSLKR